ncbi:hypothetical protein C2857_000001, partial [Epichloe festucae Fl1]
RHRSLSVREALYLASFIGSELTNLSDLTVRLKVNERIKGNRKSKNRRSKNRRLKVFKGQRSLKIKGLQIKGLQIKGL